MKGGEYPYSSHIAPQGTIFSSNGNNASSTATAPVASATTTTSAIAIGGKAIWETFQQSFSQVQTILDQNRLLIREINQNQESKIPENLSRNVGLIRELNTNIARVVELYANLSSEFVQSMEDGRGEGEEKADAGKERERGKEEDEQGRREAGSATKPKVLDTIPLPPSTQKKPRYG
jgi:hypothetical protein